MFISKPARARNRSGHSVVIFRRSTPGVGARSVRRVLQLDPLPQAYFEASSPTRRDTRFLTPVLRQANTPRVPLACH
jgi:hypothetical protein